MSMVDNAQNGLEAFHMYKKIFIQDENSYGLIFMDCSMPIMNGYDATEKIRQYSKSMKVQQPMIVALTGHTELEYIKKAWRHQMDEVVAKPANVEVIRAILEETVDNQIFNTKPKQIIE